MNLAFQRNITLIQNEQNSRIYSFNNDAFFILDNVGFGNYKNYNHNYHFTFEIHGRFSYIGGEKFTFIGDDDVFVFLNDKLVVDLGGIHNKKAADVDLDSLGLIKGSNYRFDFFYADRHTVESHFSMETSLEIFCAYYDHCDICEGNGQSCCKCDDG